MDDATASLAPKVATAQSAISSALLPSSSALTSAHVMAFQTAMVT